MEPVKGGSLANLPDNARKVFDELGNNSSASYALRFAASFPQMCMVLSGMSSMEQMNDNISFMRDFKPLDEREMQAVQKVCQIFKSMNMIPCTAYLFPTYFPATTQKPHFITGIRTIIIATFSPAKTAKRPTASAASSASVSVLSTLKLQAC